MDFSTFPHKSDYLMLAFMFTLMVIKYLIDGEL